VTYDKGKGVTGDPLFDFLIFRRFSRGTTGASLPRHQPAPVTTRRSQLILPTPLPWSFPI